MSAKVHFHSCTGRRADARSFMRDMNWTLTFVDLTVSKLMYDDVLMMYVLNDPEFLENNSDRHCQEKSRYIWEM